MNSVLLILAAVGVYALAYRFYGKFLAVAVFRGEPDAATPAALRNDGNDYVPTNRWVLLLQHVAAVSGVTTLVGVGIAMIWGWMPAFLWIVLGTVVAAGTLAVGSLWAALRKSGDSLAAVAYDMTGMAGALPVYFLGLVVLFLLAAILCLLLGQLLHAHPQAVWPFLLLIPVTALARGATTSGRPAAPLAWFGVAALLAAGLAAGQLLPLSLSGAWTLTAGSRELVVVKHELVWVGIALALAYASASQSLTHTARPRALVVGVLLVACVLAVALGIGLAHPELTAPRLHEDIDLPNPLSLIALIVTGGALSGFVALIVTGPTLRQLQRQRDAMLLGYGGVIVDGLLAVVVLTALAAGFGLPEQWRAVYDTWPADRALYGWLDLAVTQMAGFVERLGVPTDWATAAVASVTAGLALVALETIVRGLAFAVEEFVEDFELAVVKTRHFRERFTVVVVAIAAVGLSQSELGLNHWLALGLANQLFACCVLLLLTVALLRTGRPATAATVPFAAVLALTLWGLAATAWNWWGEGRWGWLALGTVVVALAAWAMGAAAVALQTLNRQRGDVTSLSGRL